MNLGELIKAAAARADDLVAGKLWSRSEWTEYANDAQREACRRARLLIDSTTADICTLTLQAGTPTYALDPRIIFVRRVKLDDVPVPLVRVSYKDLDKGSPGWEAYTGRPRGYVPDMDDNLFRPYPAPDGDYTARLTVIRDPLADMAEGEDVPEIRARYHLSLVFWMLYRAYMKHDSEAYDPKTAASNLDLFEAEFGKKSTAQDEAWIAREHGYIEDEGIY